MLFEDLRLNESLLRAVRAAGYETPTPIQAKAIPAILDGQDVLGCAQTGTGKTAAFALPLIQRLSEGAGKTSGAAARDADRDDRDDRSNRRHNNHSSRRTGRAPSRAIRAVVMCPTRELAQQIHASFTTYGAHSGLRATAIFGGVNQTPQVRSLRAGVDIVVATPGRLLDLMQQGYVNLDKIEILVLDEADHMLDMGFLPDIRRILGQMPKKRQSLLFSATMPPPIRKLANDILQNPVSIQAARVSSPAANVLHRVYHVCQSQKVALLVHLLGDYPADRALVFTRTKRGADTLTRHLDKAGIRAAAIHGNKSQAARNRALAEFRSARTPILVATDLAARGIDVDDIGHVFNYDLTPDPETYVHRIGRTARAGASGTAISFCTSAERGNLRAIEKLIRSPLEHEEIPSSIPKAKPETGRSQRGNGTTTRRFRGDDQPRGKRPTKRKSNARPNPRSDAKPFGKSKPSRHRKGQRGPNASRTAMAGVS